MTGAAIAAIYAALTLLAFGFDLASGLIQVRFSEALSILPCFSAAAVPGLFAGCLMANLITGAPIYDVAFGSLATLLAAVCARRAASVLSGTSLKLLAPLPAVLINALVIGALLVRVYLVPVEYPIAALCVGAGQAAACYGLGIPLWHAIDRTPIKAMLQNT